MLLIVLFIAFLILLIHNLWTRPKVPGLVQVCIDFPFLRGFPRLIYRSRKYGVNAFLATRNEEKVNNWVNYLPGIAPAVITFDASAVVHVLKDNFQNYIKGEFQFNLFQPFLGHGIFAVDGPLWKKQRQVASPLFSVKELKYMIPTFASKAEKLCKMFENAVHSKQSIEIQEIFQRFTLESFAKVAFGEEISCMESNPAFAKAFDTIVSLTSQRSFRLTYIIPFLRGFDSNERKILKAVYAINNFCYSTIQKRKKDPNLAERTDLLSRYLMLKDENGNRFSDQYIRDVLTSFMLAGRDTVAQLLTWTTWNLSQHPEIVSKCRKELVDVGLNSNSASDFDYNEVKNDLPFMKAILDETLRLYPPVPFEQKISVKEDVLPSGIKIPANTRVGWSLYSMARVPEFWGNDCAEWKPERWFEKKELPPGLFAPFIMGPRVCLGQQLAYLEAKMVIAILLQKFNFKVDESHKVEVEPSLTIKAKNGIKVFVSENKSE